MRCTSCGAISENSDCCTICGTETTNGKEHSQSQADLSSETESSDELTMNRAGEGTGQRQPRKSTLIEFPGVSRNSVPEWRKGLSERVREVQERRARDAAKEAAESGLDQTERAVNSAPQLELLPPAEMPAMNPLVVAALRRIERAHLSSAAETRQQRGSLATAVAYAPDREDHQPEENVSFECANELAFDSGIQTEPELLELPIEKSHNLVVVPAPEAIVDQPEPALIPKRLICDNPNDPALNYLDSISKTVLVDEIGMKRASVFRRLVCAIFDLVVCAAVSSPVAFAMKFAGYNLRDLRTAGILAGCVVFITFIYLTATTALAGRTWAMRLLSLRVIDTKTGLIPTGGQAVGRSCLYLISLAAAGLGILFALISREGDTAHDRFTRTAVISI